MKRKESKNKGPHLDGNMIDRHKVLVFVGFHVTAWVLEQRAPGMNYAVEKASVSRDNFSLFLYVFALFAFICVDSRALCEVHLSTSKVFSNSLHLLINPWRELALQRHLCLLSKVVEEPVRVFMYWKLNHLLNECT